MRKPVVVLSTLMLCALVGAAACKQDAGDGVTIVSVEIIPSAISVGRGVTKTFSAKVNGVPTNAVTWSIESEHLPGTAISNDGILVLDTDETQKIVVVRATSTADKAKYAEGSVSVSEWKAVDDSKFGTSPIRSIVYNNDKFIAVGLGGKIANSTDGGVTWALDNSTDPFGGDPIYAIAYGAGIFVAGGERGKMATFDGTTWSPVTSTAFALSSITSIAYGNDTFVAVAENGKTAFSKDAGQTWTAATVPPTLSPTNLYGIAYGDGIFVAVGGNKTLAWSDDSGDNWTLAENFPFPANNDISGIAWGNGTFVAGDGQGKMATSYDGKNWIAVIDTTFGFNNGIKSLAYGIDKFVAGCGQGKMASSSDGHNWSVLLNDVFGSNSIEALAYGNGTFVAGGNNGKIAYWKP